MSTVYEQGPLVRWGAVFSGTIIGLALTLLAGSLWAGFAFGSHQAVFYDHLAWWFAGTAIATTFLAALTAAVVADRGGVSAGLVNGLTTWGLLVLAPFVGSAPSLAAYGATRPITVNGIRIAVTTVRPWTTFWALFIGLGAAAVGGMMGGHLGPVRRRRRRGIGFRETRDTRETRETPEIRETPETTADARESVTVGV
jgi:hypothetical protein